MEWTEVEGWTECNEAIAGKVLIFEREYHLGDLNGSPKQVKFGRDSRYKILNTILPRIMELIQPLPVEDQKTVLMVVDQMRGDRSAAKWIKAFQTDRDHVAHLLASPQRIAAAKSAEAEQEEQRRLMLLEQQAWQRKGRLHAMQNRAARAWEKEIDIPPLKATSERQRAFASRCRYLFFQNPMPLCAFDPWQHWNEMEAGFWIAQYLASALSEESEKDNADRIQAKVVRRA